MTSEIRTNSLKSRAGLSTVTLTDSGPIFSGITTFLDNSIFNVGNINATGVVTATSFVGSGANLTGITQTTINNNADNRIITGSGTANTLNGEANLTFDGSTLGITGAATLGNGSGLNWGDTSARIRGESGSSGLLRFDTNGGERLRIDSSGRIGIGVVPTAQYAHNLIQIGHQATLGANAALSATGQTFLTHNLYFDTGGTFRVFNTSNANEGAIFRLVDGQLLFSNSAATTGTPTVTERFRIDSSGRVMIGTTTEGAVSGNNLTIASNTGYCGMTIRSGSSSEGNIFFSDATSGDGESVGMLRYEHNNDAMVIKTANAERIRITSDGKVGIGINNPLKQLHVFKSNEHPVMFERGDTSNTIIELKTNGATRGYWGCSTTANFIVYDNDASDVNFIVNQDGTFSGRPDQINGRTTNEVLGGKSFKYTTSNISPSWGSGSNGWYSFYHMSDGMYTFWLQTNAHSSICFTASNGYDPSNKSFINVHQFINNPNGNYGNVKGIRITNDGIVQVYLHASASNQYFTMHVQVTCGDLENMPPLYATITKETGSPTINDSWGTADAYSPAQGAHTTDGVCSPRILHNRREMSCFATSTSLYGANTSGAKGFYWDPDTASCQSAQPRNTGWSSYYINKHDGNGGSENRYIDFWLNNGQQGNITISGSGLNYGSNSDYRLKKDEVVMTDGIARVKQLRPLKFKWIKDDIDDEGFFAHEAQAVVPIAVDGTKDQVVLQSEVDAGSQRENKSAGDPIYQTMDNSKLVPVLTASIKELITKVETLEQDNIALRARVTNLEGN